jgi:hypothetical protein
MFLTPEAAFPRKTVTLATSPEPTKSARRDPAWLGKGIARGLLFV